MLGDKYDLTKYIYYTLEYETDDINAFNVAINSSNSTGSTSTRYLLRNGNVFEGTYTSSSEYGHSFVIYKNTENGASGIFTVKMWACDENKDYIGIRKITPL